MLHVQLDTMQSSFHLDVHFSAEVGKTTVLLGESGAGKSTVLRHIAGLASPQQGLISFNQTVYVDSERGLVVPTHKRPFGYVFQDYALFPHLTVFENVAFGLRAQHASSRLIRQRVGEALEQVRLLGLEQRRPAQLSGGQQQRVAIARALALQPSLLLLDEPLSALDVQTRREVRQELRRLLSTLELTTLLVTHQYVEALLFGHQILVFEEGRILQRGSPSILVQQPRSSYVAELVGVNFFRGRIVRHDHDALCVIHLEGTGEPREIEAVLEETEAACSSLVGTEAFVVTAPQSITLHHDPPEGSARNVFRGEIMHMLEMGTPTRGSGWGHDGRLRVTLLFDQTQLPLIAELTTISATQMGLHEGQNIYATFKATEARAYL